MVNGLQQFILFHVEDFKLSQKDPKVNYSFIGVLREEYQSIFGDESGTKQVKCGKVHKYLGMTLDYSTVGQAKTTMLEYIDEILSAFDKADTTGDGVKSSAAPSILF